MWWSAVALAVPLAPVWTVESNQALAGFGMRVDEMDIDGDGYTDLVGSAFNYDSGSSAEGGVAVWVGGPTGPGTRPTYRVEGDEENAWASGGSAGDVNGDGLDDLVVGRPGIAGNTGSIQVLLGTQSGYLSPLWTVTSSTAEARLGHSVGSAGDVNGDGYDDLVASAPGITSDADDGWVSVWSGGPNGPDATPDWTSVADRPDTRWGDHVEGVGDVNGDGYDDLLVGIANYGGPPDDAGAWFLYYGSRRGLEASPGWWTLGVSPFVNIGHEADHADVNGDGYQDLLLSNDGRVDLFFGSPVGPSLLPDWSYIGFWQNVGTSIAGLGDLDGDGDDEFAIGNQYIGADNGSVDILYGGATPTPWVTLDGSNYRPHSGFGSAVTSAGDTDGDGLPEVLVGATWWARGQYQEGALLLFELP